MGSPLSICCCFSKCFLSKVVIRMDRSIRKKYTRPQSAPPPQRGPKDTTDAARYLVGLETGKVEEAAVDRLYRQSYERRETKLKQVEREMYPDDLFHHVVLPRSEILYHIDALLASSKTRRLQETKKVEREMYLDPRPVTVKKVDPKEVAQRCHDKAVRHLKETRRHLKEKQLNIPSRLPLPTKSEKERERKFRNAVHSPKHRDDKLLLVADYQPDKKASNDEERAGTPRPDTSYFAKLSKPRVVHEKVRVHRDPNSFNVYSRPSPQRIVRLDDPEPTTKRASK